jgi:hypothetical protein
MMSPLNPSTFLPLRGRRARHRHKGIWGKIEDLLRYLAAGLFLLLVIFLVIGIPALLVVTSTYGLGDTIRKMVEEKLGAQGYRVTVARVLFNPVQGFILDGMQLHDRTPAKRHVVSADRLSISINLESLVRNQVRLERIFLRDATLDIPLGPTEEPRLRLDHVRGLILCPPEQFRLTSASFEIAGIAVHATGTFLNPKKFSPKPVSPTGPGNIARTIDAVQKELKAVHWENNIPELTIQASGDLSDSESLSVESATFRAGEASWHGIRLKQSSMDLHFENRKLTLDRLSLKDRTGQLQAEGWSDFKANKASLEFAGAFDSSVLPGLLLKDHLAKDWNCIDPLRLSGNFSAAWGTGKPSFAGSALLDAGRFNYRGIAMDGFSGGVALQDGKLLFRDFHLEGAPGKLDADLLIGSGDNRLRLKAALFPAKIVPAISGKAVEALSSMDFQEPLLINFEGAATALDPFLLKGSGSLVLNNGAMRGAAIQSLNATIQMADGAVDFRNIILNIDGGVGRGEFIYDFKNWEGRLPEVRSTLEPVKVMTWIDPHIAQALKDYRFRKPPNLIVSGKVGLRNPDKNDLNIKINAPAGLNYTLIKKDLPFGATSGSVQLKGQKVLVDIPRAKLFGGDVVLKAEASVKPGDGSFGASVHLADVDFQTVTKLYFAYSESMGELTADYTFKAVGGNDRAMTGHGNLLIKNGNVLAMPVLGPLSLLISDIIPGFGYQSAHKASADFTVENGVINTRNLLIKGAGFSMIGHGDIYYLDDRMALSIRLNAQGLPGLMLFPVSKIFEYESVGTASHPKWRPKILPKVGSKQAAPQQAETKPAP